MLFLKKKNLSWNSLKFSSCRNSSDSASPSRQLFPVLLHDHRPLPKPRDWGWLSVRTTESTWLWPWFPCTEHTVVRKRRASRVLTQHEAGGGSTHATLARHRKTGQAALPRTPRSASPLLSLPGRHTYLSKRQYTGLAYPVHNAVREPKHKAIHNKDHLCQFT